jgi:hypothetical protein
LSATTSISGASGTCSRSASRRPELGGPAPCSRRCEDVARRSKLSALAVAIALVAGDSRRADAQVVTRVGAEFRVNAYTSGSQSPPRIAIDTDGDFVVVWQSYLQDGYLTGVFGRRFSSVGAPLGVEFQVNQRTLGDQSNPAVARDADGDFVVVWQSNSQDGSFYGVFARRFGSSGAAQGIEFQVNTHTADVQSFPSVAMVPSGDFVVVWRSWAQDGTGYGIFGRRFKLSGSPEGLEFMVNAYTSGTQDFPAVDRAPDGSFMVAWVDGGRDGNGSGVFARRFNASGLAKGLDFQINSHTPNGQSVPAIAVAPDGDAVVVWSSLGQGSSDQGVFGQRFSSDGLRQGGEFEISKYADDNSQSFATVDTDDEGGFVVVWRSTEAQDGFLEGVFGRRFDSLGLVVGTDFQVNAYTTGHQRTPTLAVEPGGEFVVAWTSVGQDGDSNGIFAQRFRPLTVLDVDGDGEVDPLTDGLLVLRHLFAFSGSALIAAAVDLSDCTRCSADAIATYLSATRLTAPVSTALGPEFQVNTYSTGHQNYPSVAVAGNGSFVVTWSSPHDAGFGSDGIFARRFDAAGAPQAVEFQVNLRTLDNQRKPDVAASPSGAFVVVWQSEGHDGDANGIFGRRFAASGAALGGEFQVNAYTSDNQFEPAVGVDADGDFVVAWQSYGQDGSYFGVFGRRFSSAGTPLAAEFQVNSYTGAYQYETAVAMASDGGFLVAWKGNEGDLSGNVFLRLYDANGAALVGGSINGFTAGVQEQPAVAMAPDGAFVATWMSLGQDGNAGGVFAVPFDSSVVPQTPGEFQINTYTDSAQTRPSVAFGASNSFVIAWQNGGDYFNPFDVDARRFASTGAPLGPSFLVSSYTSGSQEFPDVAADGDTRFVVTWRSNGQDGAGHGVFARRFAAIGVFDIDGDGDSDPLSDGLLMLRFMFGFNGQALVAGAVRPGCTRCDAASIAAYIQSLI